MYTQQQHLQPEILPRPLALLVLPSLRFYPRTYLQICSDYDSRSIQVSWALKFDIKTEISKFDPGPNCSKSAFYPTRLVLEVLAITCCLQEVVLEFFLSFCFIAAPRSQSCREYLMHFRKFKMDAKNLQKCCFKKRVKSDFAN